MYDIKKQNETDYKKIRLREKMTKLTMADIARQAGVSKATVSRVLNEPGIVREKTRKKVLSVIRKEHYSPSEVARSLAKKVSNTVGVLVPEIDNPFFGEILRGITNVTNQHGLTLICFNSDNQVSRDFEALNVLATHRVRGLIYTPAINYTKGSEERKQLERCLRNLAAPVVLLDRDIEDLEVGGIFFNDTVGMYEATKTLIQQGHKKIAIINATLDGYLAKKRHEGYIKALEESGIPVEEKYQFVGDYIDTEKTYQVSKRLLSMEDKPTAVLTCNNRMSIAFLKAVYESDLTVSDDITWIGLDKIEALDIIDNGFNYIERDAENMGTGGINMLMDSMALKTESVKKVLLETPVIMRR